MPHYKIEARRYHSCKSKVRYRTEKQAMLAVKKYSKIYGVEYDYYDCSYCKGYHLTTDI